MNRILFFSTVVLAALGVSGNGWAAEAYSVDMVHSSIGFSIKHMMLSNVTGGFNDFQGDIKFDPADLANSKFDFVIKVASIDTKNEARDNHLRGAEFFEADKYPMITFKTSKVEKTTDNVYAVSGDLTMKGVVKQVVIPVTIDGPLVDPKTHDAGLGLEASFMINRQDYGVKWNKVLDNGGLALANDVKVVVNIEAHRTVK